MAKIYFEVLITQEDAHGVAGAFEGFDEVQSVDYACVQSTPATTSLQQQLEQVYRDQHDELDPPAGSSLFRFVLSIAPGYSGSLNQLAMTLARVLTPPAELPKEAALREADYLFEVPDTYPWVVHIVPGN